MEKKKRNLIISAVAAASVAALGNIQANNNSIVVNPLGTGAEVRNELITNRSIAKMLNDLKCGENKTDAKTDKAKGKEGKCGEGKCGEKKAKGKEGKCGEGKCGEKKAKGKEGKCGEGKCGEKKTNEQPK
ncbi:MAG: hypothetical protein Fur0023_07720 [Bacteroidia bacterium]